MLSQAQIRARVTVTESGCWEWNGAKHGTGYGCMVEGSRKLQAHNVVYEALVGPVPPLRELDHLCGNKPCVNPSHLEPVTHRENIRRSHGKLGDDLEQYKFPQDKADFDAIVNAVLERVLPSNCQVI